MSNNLVRKVIAPLIIGIPLVFSACHPKQKPPIQEKQYVSSEPLYKQGVVLEEQITGQVAKIDTKVIKKSVTGSEVIREEKSQSESYYNYFITVLSDNRKWIISPRLPPAGGPVDTENPSKDFEDYINSFQKKIKEIYDKVKPGDEIRFVIGDRVIWSDGSKDERFYNNEPAGYEDIEYTMFTNGASLEDNIQKVK